MRLIACISIFLFVSPIPVVAADAESAAGPRVRAPIDVISGKRCSTKRVYETHPRRKRVISAWERRVARRWGNEWSRWAIALDPRVRHVRRGGYGGGGRGGGSPPTWLWEASARPCSFRS